MDAQARDQADRQVYWVAREVLFRHPFAWATSHLQGTLRHLEPQTYRALHPRWTGEPWPPDVLDDALIHALRALFRDDVHQASQVFAQERWRRLTPLQRAIWWGTFGTSMAVAGLATCGAWKLRHQPSQLWVLLSTIAYILALPGPIAYERFRVPVVGPILALTALSLASPNGLCYNRGL
jgi:hypothetical protein